MPHYKQIVMCLPEHKIDDLVTTFRRHAISVLATGGSLRSIENHGVRQLPEKTYSDKNTDYWGRKSFWKARYVTLSFDTSPKNMLLLTRQLKDEAAIIKIFTQKVSTSADRLETQTYKMPFPDLPFPKHPK